MNYVFASSHLPEDNRPEDEEDEEDDVQPMLRAGGVRAYSHLPPARSLADSSGPLSTRPATPVGRPRPHDDPDDDQDTDHDEAPAAHDEYEDDTPWYMPPPPASYPSRPQERRRF